MTIFKVLIELLHMERPVYSLNPRGIDKKEEKKCKDGGVKCVKERMKYAQDENV
jgi:hypothetical protein